MEHSLAVRQNVEAHALYDVLREGQAKSSGGRLQRRLRAEHLEHLDFAPHHKCKRHFNPEAVGVAYEVNSEELAVGVLKSAIKRLFDLEFKCLFTAAQVPDSFEDPVHTHESLAHRANIQRQAPLEVVENANFALLWPVPVALLIRFDVDVGFATGGYLVAKLVIFICDVWDLDNLMNQWIGCHIYHADLSVGLPGHEASLLHHFILSLRIVAQESGWNREVNFTRERLTDDPLLVDWIDIDVLAEIWREKTKKLVDVAIVRTEGQTFDVAIELNSGSDPLAAIRFDMVDSGDIILDVKQARKVI
mmetsp:Transcript_40533/g.53170  ORF Transcript_40533/g.53170 Transcript_40533/m.53170 type:complete len:305 (+) Transcript_40533:1366-2280(+)